MPRANDSDLNYSDFLKTLNDDSYEFNNQLFAVCCDQLGSQLRRATIMYIDILAIKYELIANHSAFGE
jgi:hypothetical protein